MTFARGAAPCLDPGKLQKCVFARGIALCLDPGKLQKSVFARGASPLSTLAICEKAILPGVLCLSLTLAIGKKAHLPGVVCDRMTLANHEKARLPGAVCGQTTLAIGKKNTYARVEYLLPDPGILQNAPTMFDTFLKTRPITQSIINNPILTAPLTATQAVLLLRNAPKGGIQTASRKPDPHCILVSNAHDTKQRWNNLCFPYCADRLFYALMSCNNPL